MNTTSFNRTDIRLRSDLEHNLRDRAAGHLRDYRRLRVILPLGQCDRHTVGFHLGLYHGFKSAAEKVACQLWSADRKSLPPEQPKTKPVYANSDVDPADVAREQFSSGRVRPAGRPNPHGDQ